MFTSFTTCDGRLHVVRMELLRKMPHQNLRPDRVLSDSGQRCLVWAPSKIASLDRAQTLKSHLLRWFRCFTTCNGRLHVVRMELLRKMPHQNIRFARVLSDSGQHCVDLSPIKNYNLDGAQTLSRTNFLWLRFSKLARASNNLAVGPIEFFVIRIKIRGFQPIKNYTSGKGPNFFQ